MTVTASHVLVLACIEQPFNALRAPHPVHLAHNGVGLCRSRDPGVLLPPFPSCHCFMRDWDYLGLVIAQEQQTIAGARGKVREDGAPFSRSIPKAHQKRRLRLLHVT